jgi:hypothetical protein
MRLHPSSLTMADCKDIWHMRATRRRPGVRGLFNGGGRGRMLRTCD